MSGCIAPRILNLGTRLRFTPGKRTSGAHWIKKAGWAPELVWTRWRREKSPHLQRIAHRSSSTHHSHYNYWAIQAPQKYHYKTTTLNTTCICVILMYTEVLLSLAKNNSVHTGRHILWQDQRLCSKHFVTHLKRKRNQIYRKLESYMQLCNWYGNKIQLPVQRSSLNRHLFRKYPVVMVPYSSAPSLQKSLDGICNKSSSHPHTLLS